MTSGVVSRLQGLGKPFERHTLCVACLRPKPGDRLKVAVLRLRFVATMVVETARPHVLCEWESAPKLVVNWFRSSFSSSIWSDAMVTLGQRRLRDAIDVSLPIMSPFLSWSLGADLLRDLAVEASFRSPSFESFCAFGSGILSRRSVKLDTAWRYDFVLDD